MYKHRGLWCLLAALALVAVTTGTALAVVAFPGAEGYGKNSVGGRGGTVIKVTNLDDTGTGSFRAACEASGPRIVVFRVAGIIEIASDIEITNPYITVAGQTAPGDGVCIKFKATGQADVGISINTHDVVIRYLRVRCGFSAARMDYGSPFTIGQASARNVIVDHCSTSWHPGRTGMTIWPSGGRDATDITIQRHLAGEALLGGNYPNGARGAFLFGSGTSKTTDGYIDRITLYKSLMAHNRKRHPEAKTCQTDDSWYIATYQLINNVAYHFDNDGMALSGNENDPKTYHFKEDEVCHYNVIGNYFKRSEIGDAHSEIYITPGARAYVGDNTYGNIGPNRTNSAQDPWALISYVNHGPSEMVFPAPTSPYQAMTPFDAANLPPYETATAAYEDVLNDVGANMALDVDGKPRKVSDPVDIRLINDVRNNTGGFIRDPSDVGGWPTYASGTPYPDSDNDGMSDVWEKAKFGDLSRDGKGDLNGDGYTDLEHFLDVTDPGVPVR